MSVSSTCAQTRPPSRGGGLLRRGRQGGWTCPPWPARRDGPVHRSPKGEGGTCDSTAAFSDRDRDVVQRRAPQHLQRQGRADARLDEERLQHTGVGERLPIGGNQDV